MNLALFSSSNPNKILKNLMEQPCNNYCVDCNEPSASNVDCTHYTFVCVSCSAIHREIGDKIKSVGVSTFTPEEIEKLKETSNDEFNNIWMSGFKRGDQPLLPASNEEARRAFIFAKYRQKRWHKDSPKMVTKSHRTMFPTEEDDSDDESRNIKSSKNDYYPSNSQNKIESDDSDNDHDEYNTYDRNQQQIQQSFRRGNPFGNSSQNSPQQNLYYQNSYQTQQNTEYVKNNLDKKSTKSSTQLNTSSKNAPFQRHKSSDHSHKKLQQPFQPQNQSQPPFQPQNQSQPPFQQPNQNDLLIDFNAPQPQSSDMQSAIDDIFGSTAQQPQYKQYQQQQYQQPSYQQQPQSQPQYQQQVHQQYQQQQSFQQSQQVQQQQNSFPHKKQNQKKSKQTKQAQQTQQSQISPVDNIIDFSSTPTNQPQNQQTDDLLNFDMPNDAPTSHINDDELFNFSNPQIAAEQQQLIEKRRQLKEAMVNMSDDDLMNTRGNSNIEKLRNVGLGVQDSPTFMAKALIASGYCSQPVNQPIQRMGMQPQNQMYYGGAYQGYQQNQYYKPQ